MKSWILPVCAAVIGIGIGGFGRGNPSPGEVKGDGTEAEGKGSARSGLTTQAPREGQRYASVGGLLEDRRAGRVGRLAHWLLEADAAELAEAWEELKYDKETPDTIRELLFLRWTALDPEAALAVIKRRNFKEWTWAAWARNDVEAAFAAVPVAEKEAARTALRGLAEIDPRRVMGLLERHPELKDRKLEMAIAGGLARLDPREAVLFSEGDYKGRGETLRAWAEKDPDAALAWYLEGGSGGKMTEDFLTLAAALAEHHPGAIERLAATLPPGELRRGLLAEHARELAGRDVEAALRLLRRETDPAAQRELVGHVGAELTFRDPEAGISLLREALEGSGAGTRDGWSKGTDDWFEALAAMSARPAMELLDSDPNTPSDVRELMARKWRERDEVAFAEWLLEQEPSAQRDGYIGGFASSLGYGPGADFESAVEWTASMHGETRRRFQLRSVINHWVKRYPEEAEAYLSSSAAPEAARELYRPRVGEGEER